MPFNLLSEYAAQGLVSMLLNDKKFVRFNRSSIIWSLNDAPIFMANLNQ
jgi:hypothetical protein